MARTSTKSKASLEQTTAPAPTEAATSAPAPNAPTQYRENEQTNKKIDDWIKRNPEQFKFFNEMPHERAVRKLVLNEIDRAERRQFRRQQGYSQNNAQRQERGQGYDGGRRY